LFKTNTTFIGKVLIELSEVDSTSTYLQSRNSTDNLPEGAVVYTAFQTKGKGQRGNVWESEKGKNLLASILLFPKFLPPKYSFLLNMAVALAVRDTIVKYLPEPVSIKWPNDIWVNERKIAGILLQNAITMSTINSSIVGIGLNINQTVFSESLKEPTSLKSITGKEFSPLDILAVLCHYLEVRYLELRSEKVEKIRLDYKNNLLGRNVQRLFKVTSTGEIFSGIIRGVNSEGLLITEDSNGSKKRWRMKEIEFLRE